MPRRSTASKFGPRKKYSLCRTSLGTITTTGVAPQLGAQASVSVVSAAAAQGKRKCKNFDINLAVQQPAALAQQQSLIYYALVYVPAGSTASTISNAAGTEYYTPGSNVLAAGVYDCDEGTGFRVRTRLARNLNAGDEIQLVMRSSALVGAAQIALQGVVSYVVAYN